LQLKEQRMSWHAGESKQGGELDRQSSVAGGRGMRAAGQDLRTREESYRRSTVQEG
jgi:hypothetical protein